MYMKIKNITYKLKIGNRLKPKIAKKFDKCQKKQYNTVKIF